MSVHELLNEPVNVHVEFVGTKVRPTTVHWGTKTYAIQHVNLVHSTKEGETRIFYFSVSNQTLFMKLRFDTGTLQWRIVEFYSE
ncbi:MAG: hypothetical protein AAB839_03160 [Patescibacteria group bacterium]